MLRKRRPRPTPWNDLELPDGHKNLVQSLIESHMDGNTSRKLHFDLVRAKGTGAPLYYQYYPKTNHSHNRQGNHYPTAWSSRGG